MSDFHMSVMELTLVLLLRVGTLLKRHIRIGLTPIKDHLPRPFPLWTRGRALPA